jgi:hypothetical protein
MELRFAWNPQIEQEVKRMAVHSLTPKYRAALARVKCPDHGESPTIEEHGMEWRIQRCCQSAETLAFEAIRRVE